MNRRKYGQLILICGYILVSGIGQARADDLKSIAKKLTKAAKSLKNKRLTVLVFPYPDGNISSGTSLVSKQLSALLANTAGVEIVDGSRIAETIGQIQSEKRKAAAPQTSRTSKDWGVDAIVTGTLDDVKHQKTTVHVRLIQVPSGVILTQASAEIRRTWYDPPQPPPEPENPDAPYVMHASPLIYTPQGAGAEGSAEPALVDSAENAAVVPAAAPLADNAAYSYAGDPDPVVVDADHSRKHDDRDRNPQRNERGQNKPTVDSLASMPDIWSQCFYPALLTSNQQHHEKVNKDRDSDHD